MTGKRPNIVWIMGDEFRTDSLSCYGTPFPAVATPSIDRIAAAGVRFANCFCNSPICVPSRTSEMTANPPEVTGVYGNEGSWTSYVYDRALISFPEHFAANGYRTINFGKTHLPVALRPWQDDIHEGADLKTFFDGTEEPGPQSDQVLTPTLKAAIGGTFPGPVEFPGERVTRNAVAWLESRAAAQAPFLARFSYLQPHSPVLPPAPYAARYADLPWPDCIEDEPAGSRFEQRFVEALSAHALSRRQLRRVRSDYYGLVAWLDDQVGRILAALELSGLRDDTIIVLEADHGVSLGERGRLQKHTFFPETHRVPRIVAWPGRLPAGVVRADLCESMDLAKTLCALAGIEPAATFHGRDLFAEPPPECVFSTVGYGERESYALPNQVVGSWDRDVSGGWPRRACVRTSRYRLDMTVRRNGRPATAEDEDPYLADCAWDPEERINRARDPAYAVVLRELRSRLLAHVADSYEPPFVPTFTSAGRGIN
jgi:choline-sulfatase